MNKKANNDNIRQQSSQLLAVQNLRTLVIYPDFSLRWVALSAVRIQRGKLTYSMPGLELGLELRVEFDQSRGFYKILVYWNDLLLSFPTGVLSLPLTAPLPCSLLASFRAVPKLTEDGEEPRTRTGTRGETRTGTQGGTRAGIRGGIREGTGAGTRAVTRSRTRAGTRAGTRARIQPGFEPGLKPGHEQQLL